jgi:hypothetical protein
MVASTGNMDGVRTYTNRLVGYNCLHSRGVAWQQLWASHLATQSVQCVNVLDTHTHTQTAGTAAPAAVSDFGSTKHMPRHALPTLMLTVGAFRL